MKKSLLLLALSVSIFSCKKDFATFQSSSSNTYANVKTQKAIPVIENENKLVVNDAILNASVEDEPVSSETVSVQNDVVSNEIAKIESSVTINNNASVLNSSKKKTSFVQKTLEKSLLKKASKQSTTANAAAGKTDILALLSLIFGAAGLILFGSIGWLIGIAGFILGIIALKKKTPNRTMAILGLIFGSIAVLVGLLAILAIAAFSIV